MRRKYFLPLLNLITVTRFIMFQLERKCGLGAGRVLWQQLSKERELLVHRQVEEEREELGKMVVKAKKELVAAIQLQLEEAREQMQDEEEFVVCKYDKILYSQIVGWKTHLVTF